MPLVSNWADASGPRARTQSKAAARYGIRQRVICPPIGIGLALRGGNNSVNLPLLRVVNLHNCRCSVFVIKSSAPRSVRGLPRFIASVTARGLAVARLELRKLAHHLGAGSEKFDDLRFRRGAV